MTDKTKKIIAREGLVIVGIILLGICLLNTPNVSFSKLDVKKEYKETVLKIRDFTKSSRYAKLGEKDKALLELYRRYLERGIPPDKISFDWLNKWLDGEGHLFPLEMYNFNKVIEENRIHTLGLIILVFGYPFYWIIRFIIWAVKTLKDR